MLRHLKGVKRKQGKYRLTSKTCIWHQRCIFKITLKRLLWGCLSANKHLFLLRTRRTKRTGGRPSLRFEMLSIICENMWPNSGSYSCWPFRELPLKKSSSLLFLIGFPRRFHSPASSRGSCSSEQRAFATLGCLCLVHLPCEPQRSMPVRPSEVTFYQKETKEAVKLIAVIAIDYTALLYYLQN